MLAVLTRILGNFKNPTRVFVDQGSRESEVFAAEFEIRSLSRIVRRHYGRRIGPTATYSKGAEPVDIGRLLVLVHQDLGCVGQSLKCNVVKRVITIRLCWVGGWKLKC